MTEHTSTHHAAPRRRRPQLRRTLLGLTVAALLAAWLPFSILYINALTKHAVAVATAGGARVVTVVGRHSTHTVAPIVTRASAPAPVG